MNNETFKSLVTEYCSLIETSETFKFDKCLWKEIPLPNGETGMVIAEANLECPVHTKEGLLIGFIEWLSKDKHLKGIMFNWTPDLETNLSGGTEIAN